MNNLHEANRAIELISQSPGYYEDEEMITFFVTSKGWTGAEWNKYFITCKYSVRREIREMLHLEKFKPTKNITYKICVLKSESIKKGHSTTANILATAKQRGLREPAIEMACLIFNKLQGLQLHTLLSFYLADIIIMHRPILNKKNNMFYLIGVEFSEKNTALDIYYEYVPEDREPQWFAGQHFAFFDPQSTNELQLRIV